MCVPSLFYSPRESFLKTSFLQPLQHVTDTRARIVLVHTLWCMDDHFGLGGSLLAAAEDVREAVLEKIHAAALRQLKAASAAWCKHVRRELCNRLWVRLCRREGQPEPAGEDSITDLVPMARKDKSEV